MNRLSFRIFSLSTCLAAAFGCGDDAGVSPAQDMASPIDAGMVGVDSAPVVDGGPELPKDPIGFENIAALSVPRSAHSATLLEDGRVLLVGGESVASREPLNAVDIFDPATDSIVEAADLPEARSNHQAVLLKDGRVLVVGGGRSAPIGAGSGEEVLASALLYDPARDLWEETGSLAEGRSHFGAVLLDDGRVLVTGGTAGTHENGSICTGAPDCGPLGDTLASTEIYDPVTGTFEPAAPLGRGRTLFTIERLSDGRVLAAAGMNDRREGFATTEIFDPSTGDWTPGPDLGSEPRIFHASALLPSGRVLVGGGKLPDTYFLDTVDVVDPSGETSMPTAALSVPQTLPRFVSLASGRVLSVGGFRCPSPCEPIAEARLYDEAAGAWESIGALQNARAGHTATLLKDGRVLVCGGFTAFGNTTVCEISVE